MTRLIRNVITRDTPRYGVRVALSSARRMKRPRIYGSEPECEAAVARAIQRAEQLLDQAVDVRSRMVAHIPFHKKPSRESHSLSRRSGPQTCGRGSETLARR